MSQTAKTSVLDDTNAGYLNVALNQPHFKEKGLQLTTTSSTGQQQKTALALPIGPRWMGNEACLTY